MNEPLFERHAYGRPPERTKPNVDHLLGEQTLIDASSFLGCRMRELIQARVGGYGGMLEKTKAFLEARVPLYDPDMLEKHAIRLAGELFVMGTVDMDMKTFALGLQILGFESMNVELTLSEQGGGIPMSSTGKVGLGGPV
jgi:hypothetical protein